MKGRSCISTAGSSRGVQGARGKSEVQEAGQVHYWGQLMAATPEEYVEIAVRLGTDPDHRRDARTRISQRSPILFEDLDVVREHERFLEWAIASHERGWSVPGELSGQQTVIRESASGLHCISRTVSESARDILRGCESSDQLPRWQAAAETGIVRR